MQRLNLCSDTIYKIIKNMAAAGINTVVSTSCGRLFDAVSAILNIKKVSTFEGEASTSLQFAADAYAENELKNHENIESVLSDIIISKDFLKTKTAEDGRILIATDALFKYIVESVLEEKASDMLAYHFHYILAKQICDAVRKISGQTGIRSCALTGGVFQNTLLLALCDEELSNSGLKVLRHSLTPPNDGGLALGQAAYGMHALAQNRNS